MASTQPADSHDLLYKSNSENSNDADTLKIEKLYELLAALDEVALHTSRGKEYYPSWILNDVKTLYDILRYLMLMLST